MGRDKPKKFSNMGYFEKEEYKNEMAKKYGIQGTEYRDSRGNKQTRRNDTALKAAMRNDFDYRTSAQHMDGVKGNASMKDFTKYERSAVKLHKQAGNGGEYSSNEDITTVTNNLVDDYRSGLADQIASRGLNSEDEQSDNAVMPTTTYETSPETVKARETVKEWEASNSSGDVYGTKSSSSSPAYGTNTSSKRAITTNVDDFAQNFKNNVKDEMKFKPDIPV